MLCEGAKCSWFRQVTWVGKVPPDMCGHPDRNRCKKGCPKDDMFNKKDFDKIIYKIQDDFNL